MPKDSPIGCARSDTPDGRLPTIEEFHAHYVSGIAWRALQTIAVLKEESSDLYAAIALGRHLGFVDLVRKTGPAMIQAIAAERARRAGGTRTAKTTEEEKRLIIKARNDLAKSKEWPKIKAAGIIAAQLRTGTFPGIDRPIDYNDKYVASLRVTSSS